MGKQLIQNIVEEYAGSVLMAIVILVIGFLLSKLIMKITKQALKRTELDESLHTFIEKSVNIIFYILLFVVVLSCLKVPTAPLVTVLGACGAAIALALKDSLGNIASGIIILINTPFKKGDYIEVAGISGMVQSIGLWFTTLLTYDNKVVTIPNGTVTGAAMTNYTREQIRRVDCTFSVSYETDLLHAKDVLKAVTESVDGVLSQPGPTIGVAGYQDSCILLDCKVWCDTANYGTVKYALEEQVKLAFDVANITIPYPQMDVHVVK